MESVRAMLTSRSWKSAQLELQTKRW